MLESRRKPALLFGRQRAMLGGARVGVRAELRRAGVAVCRNPGVIVRYDVAPDGTSVQLMRRTIR